MKRRDFILRSSSVGAGLMALSACEENGWKKEGFERQKISGPEVWRNEITDENLAAHRLSSQEILDQARERIERYRKSDVAIKIVNGAGNPVSGLKVRVVQASSSFDWGCSMAMELDEVDRDPLKKKISGQFTNLFNTTTAKCYWDEGWHHPIEHEEGIRVTRFFEQEVRWALINGIRVKGHPLVWTVRKAIPSWMDKYSIDKQMKKLENHVRTMIRVGGHLVNRWDLCNEMLWEPSLRNLPSRNWPHLEPVEEILSYLEPAVHWAREENPHAIYSLNDYGLVERPKHVTDGVTSLQQRRRYVDLVEAMKHRGCAPDAVGVQAHTGGWYEPGVFRQCLDDLSQTGLPVQVTEFWARAKANPDLKERSDEYVQDAIATYAANMYTVAFGHPAVTHFTYWGGGGIDTKTGEVRPMYKALYNLIKNTWTTKGDYVTDEGGVLSLRAFHGSYYLQYNDQLGNPKVQRFEVLPWQGYSGAVSF